MADTCSSNPYLPHLATIQEVITETANIKTFRVTLNDKACMDGFTFEPGQTGQLSIFGAGESTFVINSSPTQKDYLQFSVMKTGEVTEKLHKLQAGDTVGVRAPLGNHFPYETFKGKDIILIAGGIGMAPIRTIMQFMIDNKKDYGKISLLYGARTPQDFSYAYEFEQWEKDIDLTLTIDKQAEGWDKTVGLIPNVLLDMKPSPKNCMAILCGPPIMIRFTLQALEKLEFKDDQIITTLERRMKCGIGKCGRCNIGPKYVCIDGPVFSLAQLKELPDEL